ncbi:MAG: type II toxin-antitoxin system ParD family antitoxin [Thermodesulfobacteriota bacterium]
MSLEMTPEIEEMVQTILGSGKYGSKAELLHEALDLLKKRDELRREVSRGLAELEAGNSVDGEEVLRRLEERAAKLANRDQ